MADAATLPDVTASDPDALRNVGPQDVDSAGELVARVGAHNRGQELIQAVAAAKPAAVRAAQSRPDDQFRTPFLDLEAVAKATKKAWGKDVEKLEGARVVGKGADPDSMQVVVLFLTPSGRTARGVLPYKDFQESEDRFADALDSGSFDPFVTTEDRAELTKQVAKARAAAKKSTQKKSQKPADKGDLTAGTADQIKAKLPNLSDDDLSTALREENGKSRTRKSVVEAIKAEQKRRAESD